MTEPASPPPPASTTANPPSAPRSESGFLRHMKSIFIGGLIALIPLFVSLWILGILFNLATGFSYPIARLVANSDFFQHIVHLNNKTAIHIVSYILALIFFVAMVYIIGLLGSLVVGRQLLNMVDNFIENLPLLKGIYGTTKQVISVFRQGGGGAGFQRVVLVEFPRLGCWTLAFVTNEVTDSNCGQRYLTVFIPMTPNPTSGFFQFFPAESVRETDWTVDQGIKIVLSGGMLAPKELHFGCKENPTSLMAPPAGATSPANESK